MQSTSGKNSDLPARETEGLTGCVFALTPPEITIGVVTAAEPSSLSLLAAGVAGIPGRRAKLKRIKAARPNSAV